MNSLNGYDLAMMWHANHTIKLSWEAHFNQNGSLESMIRAYLLIVYCDQDESWYEPYQSGMVVKG